MKKVLIVFVILAALCPLYGLAQSRIITNNADTLLVKDHVVWGKKLSFINIETNNKESIQIEEIKQFEGDLYRRQQKIFRKINPDVAITESQLDPDFFKMRRLSDSPYSSGDYLTKAGKSYQASTALYIVGAGAALAGVSMENDAVLITGGALSVAGLLLQIVGHSHLIKAGQKLNQQGLALKLSESGTGLALVF